MESWKIKAILKNFFSYVGIIYGVVFFVLFLICEEFEIFILIFLGLLMIPVVPMVIIIIIYWITNLLKNKNGYKGYYYREIENLYPPAMLSYLLDDFIEKKEDLLATVLNLSIKKVLNIKKSNEGLIVDVIAEDHEIEKLYNHEKYVVNVLKNKEKIDFGRFYQNVIDDCEINKLISRKKSLLLEFFIKARGIIAIIACLGLYISLEIGVLKLSFISIIFIIIAYVLKFAIKIHKKTGKGMEFFAKTKMLKNYIREYTLLKEKDYNYMEVVDKYVPYALSLGEASKIEDLYMIEKNKFIKDIIENSSFLDDIINMY